VTNEEKYVAAAYLVVFLGVLFYVLIISAKLSRLEREVEELARLAARRRGEIDEREEVPVG
jgi:CcmD family protein